MNIFIQLLTYFRIIAGPIIFLLILISQSYGIALSIFLLAGASDYWDGYLARKYSLTSVLGAVIDPIADKILITFTILALALNFDSIYLAFMGGLILAREFWVAALRDLNARNNQAHITKVTLLAKIKTAIQFCALGAYMLGGFLGNTLILFISDFVLLLAMLITIITGIQYTKITFNKR
jgi:CDP-diacylglycerol--glycerol-3-phosphate 3-phosphatidyltransferase